MKEDKEPVDLLLEKHFQTEVPDDVDKKLHQRILAFKEKIAEEETPLPMIQFFHNLFFGKSNWKYAQACVLCLFFVIVTIMLLWTYKTSSRKVYFKCLNTKYSDVLTDEWTIRRLVVRKSNGKEKYCHIEVKRLVHSSADEGIETQLQLDDDLPFELVTFDNYFPVDSLTFQGADIFLDLPVIEPDLTVELNDETLLKNNK